ncbi:conserved domain protein [Haemophilus pittmaniae HK 85]|uniref:Conserved domain protein n=1 Tax=Haemophilus pittmaniae HK 85 TaxID=1035188 RepID=F9QC31_9PAST|nr:virulence factor SrfC family protein [Haemophilus pittmaniae]EGV04879.1 conserved domain protein [Haemophilus pittmaniae HK 85]
MTDNQLTTSWDKVFQASQQAIDWVNDVRPNVARLNNEADGLILELRRLRNTAKRLGAVSSKPITAGFLACLKQESLFNFRIGSRSKRKSRNHF